jgi:hypothetical protein
VILIILDTLREDYSGGLQDLVNLGFVKYKNAVATAPWTIPSHASIFTGLLPSQHGVHEARWLKGRDLRSLLGQQLEGKGRARLLAYLQSKGYTTYGLSCNALVSSRSGHAFAVFKRFDEFGPDPERTRVYREGREVHRIKRMLLDSKFGLLRTEVLRRLSRALGVYPIEKGSKYVLKEVRPLSFERPFFLFINLMEAHNPYSWGDLKQPVGRQVLYSHITSKPFTRNLNWKSRYGKHANLAVARAISLIRDFKRVLDESLIIVTSDHGQLIGERNRYDHYYFLDDELLKVPLYVKFPEKTPPLEKTGHYISSLEIPRLVETVLEHGEANLGTDIALAESFGPHTDISYMGKNESERELLRNAFFRRVKLYVGHGSGVYNESTGEIEDICGDVSERDLENAIGQIPKGVTQPRPESAEAFSREEEGLIESRLRELGYF